jgi:hypothetical protein
VSNKEGRAQAALLRSDAYIREVAGSPARWT